MNCSRIPHSPTIPSQGIHRSLNRKKDTPVYGDESLKSRVRHIYAFCRLGGREDKSGDFGLLTLTLTSDVGTVFWCRGGSCYVQ